jgi:hypothetical protein
MIINHNDNCPAGEWDELSEVQQKLINQELEQAELGLGTPLLEVNKNLKEKYGLKA